VKLVRKVFFGVGLIISLLLTIGAAVFAESEWQVTVNFDEETDLITVSGSVHHIKDGIPMTLHVLDSQNSFMGGFQTIAYANDEGSIKFSFDSFSLPLTVPSGIYKLEVSGYGIGTSEPYYHKHVSSNSMFDVLTNINKAITENTSIADVILNNANAFYMDINTLKEFDADAKIIFQTIMAKDIYVLPSDVVTDENKGIVKAKMLEFKTNYQYAIKIASFANIATHADVKRWFETYADSYNFEADGKSYTYVKRILEKDEKNRTTVYANRLRGYNKLTEETDIKNAIYEEALLGLIETGYHSELALMVSDFPSLFPVSASFLNLSEEQKNQIYSEVVGNSYADLAAVTEAINSLVPATDGTSGNKGASPTGRGSSNWGSSSGSTVSLPPTTASNNEMSNETKPLTVQFTDLASALWAQDAIHYLSEKQIIVGKADDIFAPNDLISRAEFIKMVVIATNLNMKDGISSFVDVQSAEWFAPYIVAAEKAGLILGNEKKQFNPNQSITRQDMAVILYRALDINQPLGLSSVNFADKHEISDYALEQVAYFAERGIIKGVGNNCFAPMKNATRAQAAQMIYNILTFIN
jgi:hypothetical protein